MNQGILYVVATPIGNLEDITFRAIRIFKEVDFIICEDTRHSGQLLKHFEIKKPLISFHEHTPDSKARYIVDEIKSGKNAALISDSGTPLISDPGFEIVREAAKENVRIESIPGPCAFVSALVVSGLPVHSFLFAGFLPQKAKKKEDSLRNLISEPRTLVFYESPYRLLASLKSMLHVFGDRPASVSKELTKKFEETIRGKLSEIIASFEKKKILGEWVIAVAGLSPEDEND